MFHRLFRIGQLLTTALRYGLLSRRPRAQRLRLALEGLGPIFVKLGQVLSTRADLLPVDIAQELTLLQDRVRPFDGRVAIRQIERSYGCSVKSVFAEFDQVPVASASIAQVHFAVLRKEQIEVAVKVLRPNMLRVIEKDLSLMRMLAWAVEKFSADGPRLKPRAVVAEFDTYLHDELDLVREAANAAELQRTMRGFKKVLIPSMHWDYCRADVLVMQRMHGIPVGKTQALIEAGVDLKMLARNGVDIFYTQVFGHGFFHADLHPGNILISVDAATFGHLILLDFGIVGALNKRDKEYLAQNFAAFFNRNYRRVAELHIESGWVPSDTRVEELESAIRTVCEPYFNKPLKDVSLGMILLRLFQVSRRFKVEIQPQLVLLQKTLLNVEGLARQLDSNLDLWAVSRPFLERWMRDQYGPKALLRALRERMPQYLKIMPELPILIHRFLEQQVGLSKEQR